ncbi:MAG: GNAT family N-acetyltransferase [Elsteraceae bacterium]
MLIRDATLDDMPGLLAIYNEVIRSSTAVYLYDPVTLDSRIEWLNGRRAQGFPVLVAVDGDRVLGFASFGDWRPSTGYLHTVEHSVHVAADQRGKGVGRALMLPLFDRARAMNKHVMIGGIDADNAPSIAFHRRLGFEQVSHFREVGRKFGRWLDLAQMQKFLDEPGSARAP